MSTMTAQQVLDRHYLEIRCELLNLAAALDRIERHAGAEQTQADPRMRDIRQGLRILSGDGDDRAEQIQILFSDPYREGWNR